jgi:cell wall-associated NlpC family hydrolase
MKKTAAVLLAFALLCGVFPASALVERRLELNAAFSMLEEGNPFLVRYNEITGANIKARYPLGLPYLFGGKDFDKLMTAWYATDSSKNFTIGRKYLYGFDCSGFINWINFESGKPQLDTLEQMITNRGLYRDNQLDVDYIPFSHLWETLQVGDFLVANEGSRHIMMYIGTLSDYGYTAEDAPELKDYLTYPLLIHCGLCPPYAARYQAYIDQNGLNCNTTDGGVAVSIVGMSVADAPHYLYQDHYDHYYFDLNGYFLRVYDIQSASSYVWFRE